MFNRNSQPPIALAHPIKAGDFVGDKFEQYLTERLGWYDRHANLDRILYFIFQSYVVGASLAVPVLLKLQGINLVFIAAIAASVAAAQSASALFGWQRSWLEFRTAAELIRTEIHLFRGGAPRYSGNEDENKRKLIARIETIAAKEYHSLLESKDAPDKSTIVT